MKHPFKAIIKQTSKVITISALLLLYGCGGGDGSEGTASAPKSILLADNIVPEGTRFANFKSTTFTLNPSTLPLVGNRLFLKLNHQNSNVIYLGEIDRYRQFSIVVEVRLDESQLFYELFTNDINDGTTFGVINL